MDYITVYIYIYIWFVFFRHPSEKSCSESQLGWWNSQYGKIKKCSKPPTRSYGRGPFTSVFDPTWAAWYTLGIQLVIQPAEHQSLGAPHSLPARDPTAHGPRPGLDSKKWFVFVNCQLAESKPWYLVNPKIAGKWMFIPLKMVCIGIDP